MVASKARIQTFLLAAGLFCVRGVCGVGRGSLHDTGARLFLVLLGTLLFGLAMTLQYVQGVFVMDYDPTIEVSS